MRVVASGKPDAPYYLVGEALGEEEDEWGRPFIGASGRELYRMLEEAGWLPRGAARAIISALHLYHDEREKRWRVSLPDTFAIDQILDDAGIYLTNMCHERPPRNEVDRFFAKAQEAKREHIDLVHSRYPRRPIVEGCDLLRRQLTEHCPRFILALGGSALWALAGVTGITNWRGSILCAENGPVGRHGIKLIPTFHPADILREYPHRAIALQDMRRALRERRFPEIRKPTYHFLVRPSYAEATEALVELAHSSGPLAGDIETPHGWRDLTGHIACIGFAWNNTDAVCIPLMCVDNLEGYWTPEQETDIVLGIRRVLTSREMIFCRGIFECQHFARHWGFLPRWKHDVQVMQHVLLPGLLGGKIDPQTHRLTKRGSSLALYFLSSMYCEYHRFWKNDGKDWNRKEIPDEDSWWRYNCEDNVRTFECFEVEWNSLEKLGLIEQYIWMMQLAGPVMDMMLRGMPVDTELRDDFRNGPKDEITGKRNGGGIRGDMRYLQKWINDAVGHDLNTGSNGPTGQMQKLFYDDFGLQPIWTGRGNDRRKTLDDDALETIAKRAPLLAPLCYAILDERSLAHFDENILSARVSDDGTFKTEIAITGTETLRFASTQNCFGEALNLQNINRMPDE